MKLYLFVLFLFSVIFVFVVPTYLTYKKTGINPITFGKESNAHNYVGNVYKFLVFMLLMVFVIHFLNIELYNYFLVPIHYLELSSVFFIGFFLLHFALFWIFIAQKQMGNSWRIGIDEKNKSELVTHGLFSISRNPVFLGMMLSLFSIFMVLPNILTFFIAFTGYIVIQIQIRLEEEFLLKEFGQKYIDYKNNTRRLI
ncbi:methyltransferase family protein [Cloacibacterium caeni]|uniref:methyltransferase family protein n=1 Tax=Cloacibacterium caeni TaxID=2004710 RepID=UPI001BCD15FE|nr:isoprenylcysteine carboxylmethyltransferase family protein [Cloacibacterium caeni]